MLLSINRPLFLYSVLPAIPVFVFRPYWISLIPHRIPIPGWNGTFNNRYDSEVIESQFCFCLSNKHFNINWSRKIKKQSFTCREMKNGREFSWKWEPVRPVKCSVVFNFSLCAIATAIRTLYVCLTWRLGHLVTTCTRKLAEDGRYIDVCIVCIDVKKFIKKRYIVSVLDDNSQCQNLNQPPPALLRIQPLQRQLKTLQKSLWNQRINSTCTWTSQAMFLQFCRLIHNWEEMELNQIVK